MRRFSTALVSLVVLATGLAAASLAPDVGPKADVAAVKRVEAAAGNKVIAVHVSGNYALVNWYDAHGSGPAVLKRVGGKWKVIYTDGGVTFPSILIQHGIPAATARQLCAGWPRSYTVCGRG